MENPQFKQSANISAKKCNCEEAYTGHCFDSIFFFFSGNCTMTSWILTNSISLFQLYFFKNNIFGSRNSWKEKNFKE